MVQRHVVKAAQVLHLDMRGMAGADRDELARATVDVHAVQLTPAEAHRLLVLYADAGPGGVGLAPQRVLACGWDRNSVRGRMSGWGCDGR